MPKSQREPAALQGSQPDSGIDLCLPNQNNMRQIWGEACGGPTITLSIPQVNRIGPLIDPACLLSKVTRILVLTDSVNKHRLYQTDLCDLFAKHRQSDDHLDRHNW